MIPLANVYAKAHLLSFIQNFLTRATRSVLQNQTPCVQGMGNLEWGVLVMQLSISVHALLNCCRNSLPLLHAGCLRHTLSISFHHMVVLVRVLGDVVDVFAAKIIGVSTISTVLM